MIYAAPGAAGAIIDYKANYENFIGGKWVAPVKGQYFENVSPVNGKVFTEIARGTAEDIEAALDAAHAAAASDGWHGTIAAAPAHVTHASGTAGATSATFALVRNRRFQTQLRPGTQRLPAVFSG